MGGFCHPQKLLWVLWLGEEHCVPAAVVLLLCGSPYLSQTSTVCSVIEFYMDFSLSVHTFCSIDIKVILQWIPFIFFCVTVTFLLDASTNHPRLSSLGFLSVHLRHPSGVRTCMMIWFGTQRMTLSHLQGCHPSSVCFLNSSWLFHASLWSPSLQFTHFSEKPETDIHHLTFSCHIIEVSIIIKNICWNPTLSHTLFKGYGFLHFSLDLCQHIAD